MNEQKEDFEKIVDIMRYLYYSCYHWENELVQAENNLLKRPRDDTYAVLEYYRIKTQKEMYDRIFRDLSKILYNLGEENMEKTVFKRLIT